MQQQATSSVFIGDAIKRERKHLVEWQIKKFQCINKARDASATCLLVHSIVFNDPLLHKKAERKI
jgi:hypothetical protein